MRGAVIRDVAVAVAICAAVWGSDGGVAWAAAANPSDAVRALMRRYHALGEFNGAVLVARRTEMLAELRLGYAEIDRRTPITAHTTFLIGSLSKQITAVAVLKLVEQGRLSLTTSISDVLPYYRKDTGSKVTIRHLLDHTAGIAPWSSDASRDRASLSTADFVVRHCSGDLQFWPGSRFAYSNVGYVLLGAIVEQVTGTSYEQALRTLVLAPLDMTSTGLARAGALPISVAAGHQRRGGLVERAEPFDPLVAFSAGGLYSTARDLARWQQVFDRSVVLSASSRTLLSAPAANDYTCGLRFATRPIGTNGSNRQVIFHGGRVPGFATLVMRVPRDGILIVLLNNTDSTRLESMARDIVDVLYGRTPPPPRRSLAEELRAGIATTGTAVALERVRQLRASEGKLEDPEPEQLQLDALGDEYLRANRYDAALAAFTLQVEDFGSADAYARLGEAQAASALSAAAAASFAKALELEPGHRMATEGLAAVRSQASVGPNLAAETATFRGSPDHAGIFVGAAPRNLARLKWRVQTGGKVRSSPTVWKGAVFVGSEDGYLYAIDAASGAIRWKTRTGAGDVSSSPAVFGDLVIVTGADGAVWAVSTATGQVQWKVPTSEPLPYRLFGTDPRTHDYWSSSPVVADGVVFVGSADGGIYALDAATGRLRWKVQTDAAVRSSPAVDRQRVYVGSFDGNLYALDRATGAVCWKFKTAGNAFFPTGEIQSSPAVANGLVYVGARDGMLYALDAVTGRPRWRSDQQMSWVNTSPAVAGGLVIIGVSDGESLVAVDAATGVERWRLKTNGRIFSSPAVGGDLVYAGNSYGFVYVVDLAMGTLRSQGYAEAAVHSSPAVAQGVLFVGSDDSCVYAFEERPAAPHVAVAVTQETLSRYEGAYRLGPDLELVVKKLASGRISIQIGTHQPFELIPFTDDEFFHPSADIQVRFVKDGSGRVSEMVLAEMGLEGRLARTK